MANRRSRPVATVAAAAAALLLVAGCSGNDEPATSASPTSAVGSGAATSSPSASAAPTASGTTAAPASTAATASSTAGAPATGAVSLRTVTGESTQLTIDSGFIDALRILQVQIEPVGGAQSVPASSGTTFTFPVTGGRATVDPAGGQKVTGQVRHQGGLQLTALGRSVTLQELVLDGDRGQLIANLAGQRVPLLPLDAADAQITRQGESVVITDDAVSLDSAAAGQLAQQLGLPTLPSVEFGQLRVTLTGTS